MRCLVVIGTLVSLSLAFPFPSTRIGGGETAKITDFPYMVHTFEDGSPTCGASVISSTWIVSAAHCFYGVSVSSVSIRAGTNKYNSNEGAQIAAANVVLHPQYNSDTNENDIALIQLKSPLSLSSTIQPIKVATSDPSAGTTSVVTGWGSTTGSDVYTPSDLLQKLELPVVGHCGEKMICAGYEGSSTSACFGDSGGPLAANNELIGIVSAGDNCVGVTIFTDVYLYRSWITSVAGV